MLEIFETFLKVLSEIRQNVFEQLCPKKPKLSVQDEIWHVD